MPTLYERHKQHLRNHAALLQRHARTLAQSTAPTPVVQDIAQVAQDLLAQVAEMEAYPPAEPAAPTPTSPFPTPTLPPTTPPDWLPRAAYVSSFALVADAQAHGFTHAIALDETTVYTGFGPAMRFYTWPGGSVRTEKPAQESLPLEHDPQGEIIDLNPTE